MAGALVSASTGVMESVLCKLSSMLEEGYRRNKRVEKDILFLRNELGSMNAVMQKHAMSKQQDSQVKAWMKEVRELAYDIEDFIHAFFTARVEEKPDPPTGMKGFIISSIRKLRELVSGIKIAEDIEELKHQVLEVSDRRKRYKVDEYTSMEEGVEAIDPRLTALYAEIGGLVGVDAPMKKIIRLLAVDNLDGEFERRLKLVSIVGFGGMGKTTLANQVYQKIKGQFDCTCFVFVSQRPNMKRLLVDLLSGLGPSCNIWDDEIQLINRTRDFLHNKR
jgi:nucleoside-triphosphatase THEP1